METIDHFRKMDIVVGIPSHNEADNIGFVVQQVDEGLQKYFPGKNCLIVDLDNGSSDNTKEAFLTTRTKASKLYLKTPDQFVGKGNAFRVLFNTVNWLQAPITIVVDADLKSITPEWIRDLAQPLLEGYDFVTPLYSRNHLDGTITNNIVYPLVYGLLLRDIRQPIGGEFAFSLSLAQYWLQQEWKPSTYQYGIDNFMTLHAILGGFSIAQVSLGAKIHKPSAPKLNLMFSQVVETLFGILSKHRDKLQHWEEQEVRVFGSLQAPPQALQVDKEKMLITMHDFWEQYHHIAEKYLPHQLYDSIAKGIAEKQPFLSKETWVTLVYHLLGAFIQHEEEQEDIVEALKPLYFARVITYMEETAQDTEEEAEEKIKEQAQLFRRERQQFFHLLETLTPLIKKS